MTPLRQRLIEDMRLRNLSPHTIDAYVLAVKQFANHFKRSPEQLSGQDVRQYLLHLVQEKQVSWSRYNIARCGLQFLYQITLGRDERFEKLPCARVPRRLPTVLSTDELRRLFDVAARDVKHKALLMTLYGAGLRISEALALKPADIDSHRMQWVPCRAGFFLPVRILSRVFRGKFIDLIKRARAAGKLIGVEDDRAFNRLLDASVRNDWVVYAKPPFGGAEQVLKYLARYTHRIAISNRRLISVDDRTVTFRWKDYAHHNRPRTMTLDGGEFLRRFLMHAVPRGFMRIRHFGLLANRVRSTNLANCRRLISAPLPTTLFNTAPQHPQCPICQRGRLIAGRNLSPSQLGQLILRMDSS